MLEPKTWMIEKNLTNAEQTAIRNGADWTIEVETDKAYLFVAHTDFGNIKMWCPKSQTIGQIEESQIKDMVKKEAKYSVETIDEAIANATGYQTLDEILEFAMKLANEKTIEIIAKVSARKEELKAEAKKRWESK